MKLVFFCLNEQRADTTDATAFTLEQDPGHGLLGSRVAVHPSPSGADRAALLRGRDKEDREKPVDALPDSKALPRRQGSSGGAPQVGEL